MKLTVHHVDVVLLDRVNDVRLKVWTEAFFEPQLIASEVRGSSALVREASVPIEIKAPVGSRFIEVKGKRRLATYFNDHGLDAFSTFYLAVRALRGFAIASAPESARAAIEALLAKGRHPEIEWSPAGGRDIPSLRAEPVSHPPAEPTAVVDLDVAREEYRRRMKGGQALLFD